MFTQFVRQFGLDYISHEKDIRRRLPLEANR